MLRCLVTFKSYLRRIQRTSRGYLKRDDVASWSRVQRITFGRALSVTTNHGDAVEEQPISNISSQGRAKAVHDLSFLISERNARSSTPQLQTPHDVKAFYHAVKSKGLLRQLSADDLSTIMQLFGSLSLLPELPSQSPTCDIDSVGTFVLHPLAPALHKHQVSGTRRHWAFVLAVAKDKVSHGLPLTDSDNYWLMRAALEDAKRISSQDPEGTDIKRCLDRARNYYLLIKPDKDDWFIHRVYLSALLDYGGHKFGNEIVMRLGHLLSWNGGLHPCVHSIFWRVITLPGEVISTPAKAHFLHILRKKLSKVRDVLPRATRPSNELVSGAADGVERPQTYDALAIRDYFVDILFSYNPGTLHTSRYLREVYPWALFESRAALCAFNDGTYATSEEEDRAAWNNLVLLSLSFAAARKTSGSNSTRLAPERGLDGGVHSQAQVLGWTVICALAALSSELHTRSHTPKHSGFPSAKGVQEIARTLWVLWRKEEAWRAGAVTRRLALICSSTTSFMALASVSGDSRLAISLVRHISDAIIYPAQLGGEILDRRMLEACAVHFAILTVMTGVGGPPQRSWGGILGSLRYAQLIPDGERPNAIRWNNIIANAILIDLAQLDPVLAYKLFKSSAENDLVMTDEVVLSTGMALAYEGHIDLAFDCLKDGRISGYSATLLLDSLLINVLRHHHDDLRRDLVRLFVKVFTDTSIRPANNQALETFIQACVETGQVKESIEIVEAVCESNPSLLRSQFLTQFVSTLVSHRQYRLLGNMLKDAWRKLPDRRSSVFRSSHLNYTERLLNRSSKTSSREVARSLPFSIYVWPLLRDHIPFHPRLARLNKKIVSLKLSNLLQKTGKLDDNTLERAVHLLVNAGRVTPALKLLSKHSSSISTKAGNIILSASLRPRTSRRQHRQIRHASARLAQLVQGRGFIPDRVTLNLLVKALLRWKSITPKATLRALFDRLTMSGYPVPDSVLDKLSKSDSGSATGRHTSPSNSFPRTPFGTAASPSARDSLPVSLQAFPKQISFARHTRPLYKMFMKAFDARGDSEGAQRVANVLRGVKESVMRERANRAEVRRIGRIKARQKLQRGGLARNKHERQNGHRHRGEMEGQA